MLILPAYRLCFVSASIHVYQRRIYSNGKYKYLGVMLSFPIFRNSHINHFHIFLILLPVLEWVFPALCQNLVSNLPRHESQNVYMHTVTFSNVFICNALQKVSFSCTTCSHENWQKQDVFNSENDISKPFSLVCLMNVFWTIWSFCLLFCINHKNSRWRPFKFETFSYYSETFSWEWTYSAKTTKLKTTYL